MIESLEKVHKSWKSSKQFHIKNPKNVKTPKAPIWIHIECAAHIKHKFTDGILRRTPQKRPETEKHRRAVDVHLRLFCDKVFGDNRIELILENE